MLLTYTQAASYCTSFAFASVIFVFIRQSYQGNSMDLRFLGRLLLYTQTGLFITLPTLASIQLEPSTSVPETVVSIQVIEVTPGFSNPPTLADASNTDRNVSDNRDSRSEQNENQDANQDSGNGNNSDQAADQNNNFDA